MLAIGTDDVPIWVPSHALRYRGLTASFSLCGTIAEALTCAILPYENPGPTAALDLPEPCLRVYLLFLPEPE